MQQIFCPRCRLEQPTDHAFCVRCGASLPVQLLERDQAKRARFFAGIKVADGDPEGAFLRVSCYRKEQTFESEEGSVVIPGQHVRFSIWVDNRAQCVMSIPETEARDLAEFVETSMGELSRESTTEMN